jgi:hypothetical protein
MASPVLNLTAFNGQVAQELLTEAVNGLDCAKNTKLLTNIPYKVILPKFTASAGARPYRLQEDFTDTLNGTDRTLEIKRAKMDFLIEPEKFRPTYLQNVRNGLTDPNAIPYESFLMQMQLDKFLSEINNDVAYLGAYNGSGTTAAAIADGWGTILAALITATTITPETLGTINNTNAVAKFQQLYRTLPEPWRARQTVLNCSYDMYDKYRDNLPASANIMFIGTNNPEGEEQLYLLSSNKRCKIVPRTWMAGSNRVIITPEENLVMGLGFGNDVPTIEIVPALSSLKCRINYFTGFQIADTEVVWCNEAA